MSELIEGRASFSFRQLQIESGAGEGCGLGGRGPDPTAGHMLLQQLAVRKGRGGN